MQNEFTLTAYLEQLKKLLDSAHHSVAAEVCEHLWKTYFVNGIYPDPFFVEADIAITEMINGEGELKPDKDVPELDAKLVIDGPIEVDQNKFSRLQRLMMLESFHLVRETMTAKEIDEHTCIISHVIHLFAHYSTFFGEVK